MLLEYAAGAKLYVPLTRMDLVQKFRGAGESAPPLDRLGGATWNKTKSRIKAKMRDMADELLKLYAERKMAEGFPFSPDSNWQREFEDAFEYHSDQGPVTAIRQIKRDMESPQPMDRLLCGDVGFGKTEVAMRAAFKALGDGKQVAVLAPTTVLAFQHFEHSSGASRRFRCGWRCSAASDRQGDQGISGRAGRRQSGYRYRYAPAALEGRRVSRSGPADRGRRAALRRAAQRTPEADEEERGRADHERDARFRVRCTCRCWACGICPSSRRRRRIGWRFIP